MLILTFTLPCDSPVQCALRYLIKCVVLDPASLILILQMEHFMMSYYRYDRWFYSCRCACHIFKIRGRRIFIHLTLMVMFQKNKLFKSPKSRLFRQSEVAVCTTLMWLKVDISYMKYIKHKNTKLKFFGKRYDMNKKFWKT